MNHAPPPFRRRPIVVIVGGCGALFMAAQLFRPALPNPPVTADLDAPASVKGVLRGACYDCHSNETRLPWFDRIAPAYWLVVHDVREGREHLNFSTIGQEPIAAQRAALFESVSHIQVGAMPPGKYTLVHPHAVVTAQQLAILKDYLHPPTAAGGAPAPVKSALRDSTPPPAAPQGGRASHRTRETLNVPPAPNGMAFMPDYKNWKVISTTNRFDNHTLRVITANAIAMEAIANNRVHPWPDGSAFAKIAWVTTASGTAGDFKQVEFMVKDAVAHRDTEGWFWGRWLGTDLTPYGKEPTFVRECTGCHAPMKENDFVFSFPIKEPPASSDRYNVDAALPTRLPGGLTENPLGWRLISSSIDDAANTMSTVYGNAQAESFASAGDQGEAPNGFPSGAVVARVTWARRADPHWFGAQIPGQVRGIDVLAVSDGPDGKPLYTYEEYAGFPLQKASPQPVTEPRTGLAALLSERASRLP